MAVQGPFKVAFGDVFPYGAFIKGGVEAVRDFDRSTRENFVQARDKESGELVWAVEVLDADPESKGTFKVKLSAAVQPVMPEAPAGFPFVPVEFDGLNVPLRFRRDFTIDDVQVIFRGHCDHCFDRT